LDHLILHVVADRASHHTSLRLFLHIIIVIIIRTTFKILQNFVSLSVQNSELFTHRQGSRLLGFRLLGDN